MQYAACVRPFVKQDHDLFVSLDTTVEIFSLALFESVEIPIELGHQIGGRHPPHHQVPAQVAGHSDFVDRVSRDGDGRDEAEDPIDVAAAIQALQFCESVAQVAGIGGPLPALEALGF